LIVSIIVRPIPTRKENIHTINPFVLYFFVLNSRFWFEIVAVIIVFLVMKKETYLIRIYHARTVLVNIGLLMINKKPLRNAKGF
jgi:hypothetical protein